MMVVTRTDNQDPIDITLGEDKLEVVDEVRYLGSLLLLEWRLATRTRLALYKCGRGPECIVWMSIPGSCISEGLKYIEWAEEAEMEAPPAKPITQLSLTNAKQSCVFTQTIENALDESNKTTRITFRPWF